MGLAGAAVCYNVFFSPKPGVEDERVARQSLDGLKANGKLRGYRILKVTKSALAIAMRLPKL